MTDTVAAKKPAARKPAAKKAAPDAAPVNAAGTGKIAQVIGAVVDVEFDGHLPAILNALHTQNIDQKTGETVASRGLGSEPEEFFGQPRRETRA